MEAFSLLKYWKTGGGGGGGPDPFFLSASRPAAPTVLTATSDEDNDDLFDLEFAAAQEDSDTDDDVAAAAAEEDEEEEEEEAEELGFPLCSSSSSNDRTTVSPEPNSGGPPPSSVLLPSLINKSATKFRVFFVGLKKPKPDAQRNEDDDVTKRGKLFAVRFKLEEAPFMSSLFKSQGQSQTKSKKGTEAEPVRFSKEGVQKYLKKVKPKLRSAGAGDGAAPATGRVVVERQVSLPLKVVYKHLGKSRSGSLSAVSSPAPEEDPVAGAFGVASKRRDDSLLQQQDGIQGAILHCKKSFNASRDSDASIDPASLEKLTELLSRKPSDSNGRGK